MLRQYPRQETLAAITILTPSLQAFRCMQLASEQLRVTSSQQLMVRRSWRQLKYVGLDYYNFNGYDSMLPNGRRDGPCILIYPLGMLYMCAYYVNDEQHGVHREWFECGQLSERYTCMHNDRNGEYISWYESGRVRNQCIYINNIRHGPATVWYESGQIRKQCTYIDDKLSGECSCWNESGQLYYHVSW